MSNKFEYTTIAQRYTGRFPMLTYIGTQVNFWIVANILLVVVMNLQGHIIEELYKISVIERLDIMLWIAVLSGVSYGLSLGLADYYLWRKFLRTLSLGKIIVFKALISLAVLIILVALVRFVLLDALDSSLQHKTDIMLNETAWRYLFYLLLIYYFFMTLVINFINQVNTKYGPGVLLPLLLGKYRNPQEEERIFMFMDLKSSTTTAEQLGHLKYSAFIRDCFADINEVLFPFRAQVYQYVGDEIVVMWPEREGLKKHFCILFYFACKKQFRNRESYYRKNYGFLPDFKAGLHMGKVTAVEIGEIKKDIAYHGDTLNTTARIQSICNEYNKDFLVSEYLLEKAGIAENMKLESLGMILLRGKAEKIAIVSVDLI